MRSPRTVLTSKYVKALSLTFIACVAIFFFVTPGRTAEAPFLISEFRLRGPNGSHDEFIEIYNNTDSDHTVKATDGNAGLPEDTNNNSSDFIFVDTNGTSAGAGQRLGAPGPENLGGARDASDNIEHAVVDPAQPDNVFPNVARDLVSDPAHNATFGKLSIRRTYTNNTGTTLTALRFRIVNLSTFPSPAGTADLRPMTSFAVSVPLTNGGGVVAEGTDLDTPPTQANGGGVNSSIRGSLVNLINPLPDGVSVSFNFLMGVQQKGCYSLALVAEALPAGGSDVFLVSGDTEGGSGTCAAPTPTPTPTPTPVPGGTSLIISEFRLRGPNGANDEFIEIYNNSNNAISVQANDGSSGYAVAASDGLVRFVIPNGTIIPARGHFLGVNSLQYSLANYPAGSGVTANGNATYTLNINDNAGIALFRTANSVNFNLVFRLDAVGSTSVANAIFREGAGLPTIAAFSIDYSWHRNIPTSGAGAGVPQVKFADPNATSTGGGQRLGAPGPENLSSPSHLISGSSLSIGLVDGGVPANAMPNYVRNLVSDPINNSTFGTIDIRRRLTNKTGAPITRLRVRIIDLTTFPAPGGTADLRARSSNAVIVSLSGGGTSLVRGTTLVQPPTQANGGGFNSSMSAGAVTLAAPLNPNGSIDLRFLFGVQQQGKYNFCAVIETLPFTNSAVTCFSGATAPAAARGGDRGPGE